MKRPRTPAEKKAMSYDRDRVSIGAKAPHTFRKSWPRKKAKAQRAYRRRIAAEANAVVRGSDTDEMTYMPRVNRRVVRKWSAPTLREWIEGRSAKRRAAHGRKARSRRSQAQYQIAYYDHLVHAFVRDFKPLPEHNLSNVVEYVRCHLEPRLPRNVWDNFLRQKPDWVKRLREWRRNVAKERERLEVRRRTRHWR